MRAVCAILPRAAPSPGAARVPLAPLLTSRGIATAQLSVSMEPARLSTTTGLAKYVTLGGAP
jgi:hypothetical protein